MSDEQLDELSAFVWKILEDRWSEYGQCRSCGWHASLSEYDADDLEFTIRRGVPCVELPCLNKDDPDDRDQHRGVRVWVKPPKNEAAG